MKPTLVQIGLAAVTTLVALLAGSMWFEHRKHAASSVELRDNSAALQQLFLERQQQQRTIPSKALGNLSEPVLVREALSEADASRLFAMPPEHFVYDPQTFYRYKGGLVERHDWDEYPGGFFIKRTSREGYCEDFEHLPDKRDLFVVVTGDSHTDGLCENKCSFVYRLEAELANRHPSKAIEVLNTGVTGYSFYNYLGVLEKHLALAPDAFVVAFYGGNDFLDMLKPWSYFNRVAPPPRRSDYWEQMTLATKVSGESVAMAFNQLLYFRYYPDQIDIAVEAAAQASAQIRRTCEEHRIKLVYVYIPPGLDIGHELKPVFAKAKETLGLSDFDLRQSDQLADRLIGILGTLGIEVIDLRRHFNDDIGSYYWRDLHINLKGQQLIADLLLPRIEALCPIQ